MWNRREISQSVLVMIAIPLSSPAPVGDERAARPAHHHEVSVGELRRRGGWAGAGGDMSLRQFWETVKMGCSGRMHRYYAVVGEVGN